MTKHFHFFKNTNINPTRMVVIGFMAIILLGAFLLWLPISSNVGHFTDPLICLFTATSATCVTGLVQMDTAIHWSFFGQVVIITLIQLGGLGFVSLITLIAFMFNQRIGLSQRMVMASALNLNQMSGVVRLVRHALMGTFLIEGVGAVILSIRFIPIFGLVKGLWYGVFHAVSAFCNAGFDLMGTYSGEFTSLEAFRSDPVVLLTIASLVVVGGLGFFVWEDFLDHGIKKLSLYSKLVLSITAGLIVFGAIFFYLVEWNNPATLQPMSYFDRAVNSLFQSITLRTAGFATITQGAMDEGAQVMSILMMLVGGSSGSTAGGIKTVTVGILFFALRDGLRGRSEVVIRHRTIPQHRVMNAMTLTLVVMLMFLAGAMTVTVINDAKFLPAAFEVASAMGTVGLTTGITPYLNRISTVIIILMMFLGRVGILSFSIAFLSQNRHVNKIHYPTVDVLVG